MSYMLGAATVRLGFVFNAYLPNDQVICSKVAAPCSS
jgi:hypothetical protein